LKPGAKLGGCLVGMPSPFKICDGLTFDNSIVHTAFQQGSWLYHRGAYLIPEKMNTYIMSDSVSAGSLRFIMQLY